METDNNRPNAALINREWYTSALSVLSTDSIGHVLVAAVEYVFTGSTQMNLSGAEKIVFTMIKPALDSDIVKYRERCIRNAQNAKSRSQRVGASGCEWERVGANTTTTSTPTPTTTSTPTPSLSPEEIEEREKWLIFGYFWSIGSKAIKEECGAFWAYYESLGWKNNKGAAIVSKLACARMWKCQYETGAPKNGADAWFKVVQEVKIADYSLWLAFWGAEKQGDFAVIRLHISEEYERDFNEKCGSVLISLAKLWRVQEVRIERV